MSSLSLSAGRGSVFWSFDASIEDIQTLVSGWWLYDNQLRDLFILFISRNEVAEDFIMLRHRLFKFVIDAAAGGVVHKAVLGKLCVAVRRAVCPVNPAVAWSMSQSCRTCRVALHVCIDLTD